MCLYNKISYNNRASYKRAYFYLETYLCLRTSNFLGKRLIYARSDLYVLR